MMIRKYRPAKSRVNYQESGFTPPHNLTKWIGAASFEERSLGSLRELLRTGTTVNQILILIYQTETNPPSEGELRRQEYLEEMEQLAAPLGAKDVRRIILPAYSYGAAERTFSSELRDGAVLDVSCLTKVHSLAAASAMAAVRRNLLVAYTTPQNYPGVSRRRRGEGWRDVIVVPLARTARFFNENNGRGIVLLGHESDRLVVALAEIEPAGGCVILATSETRPDLGELARRRNQKIIRQLSSMRTAEWKFNTSYREDLNHLLELVRAQVNAASKHDSPIILFPYGPKPFVVATGYELAASYKENSWFVYPIPRSYDAGYSEGVGDVQWYAVTEEATSMLQRAAVALVRTGRP